MNALVLQPTPTAQWHALVNEAETAAATALDEELESYLVFLLIRFTSAPELAGRVMALEFLEGLATAGSRRGERLRDVGDQCLLLAGLFPQQARRRLVRVGYFVDLGRTAYSEAAAGREGALGGLFTHLAEAFVSLMEVLHAMRELGGDHALDPLAAHELWEESGSRRALARLARVTGATPVRTAGAPEKGRMH